MKADGERLQKPGDREIVRSSDREVDKAIFELTLSRSHVMNGHSLITIHR